jgi:branched-chain amino acid transport system substrate-binding protein
MLMRHAFKLGVLLLSLASDGVAAEPIVFGQTLPYSGPTSGWSAIGKVQAAYFKMINATGSVRGRQLQQLSLDDAYTPSKTVEQTRRLVESDKVLFMFGSLGDTNQAAVQTYLNSKKVPQIFIFAGGTRWNDPEHFPWTMQWPPTFKTEALLYAKYIQQSHPNARIAVLYQNSDFGKDYLKGLEVGLGAAAGRMIVARASYEPTSPTIDSQMATLASSKATVFFNATTPKFAAQAIRKAAELNWRPTQVLALPSASIQTVLEPAGLDHSVGIISSTYMKDVRDPQWASDAGLKKYLDFMSRYVPGANAADVFDVSGYLAAQALVHLLQGCGDDLSRENVMKQATSISNLELDMLLPGIRLNNSASNYSPTGQLRMMRFNGSSWELFGEVLAE